MNDASTDTHSVVVERELSHPPEKVWRALTQPHLIEEWLAKMDFKPVTGHRFSVKLDPQPNRTFVFDCEVTTVEPNRVLSYTWCSSDDESGNGLRTAVTWTLTPTPTGTRLRMEQSGFPTDQPLYHLGAKLGWPKFLTTLDEALTRIA